LYLDLKLVINFESKFLYLFIIYMPKTNSRNQSNQIKQTNQINQSNQNNTGMKLFFGILSLFILGCIYVFLIKPMFKKKTVVDCSGNWTEWTICDATCDGINAISSTTGIKSRRYNVTIPASNGGVSCPISPQIEKCIRTDCPVNCIGEWSTWSDCDAFCDGINVISSRTGSRERTYKVTTPAINGGISCPLSQIDSTCIKTDCPVNCVGEWNIWSDCDATCDGINASVTGTTTRTFTVITPKSNNGTSCPISPETEKCKVTNCPINCIGEWNGWSDCDSTCDGINTISPIPGTRSRTFKIITPASNNGSCPISPQIDSKCIKSGCLAKIVATTTPIILVGLNPNQPSSGEKYIVFNYTSDSVGLSGQTEYTFNVTNNNIDATILIVGGGGGGGNNGGGGGGGDVLLNNITLPIGTHKIRVGKGGSGGPTPGTIGQRGSNSELILQSGTIYTYCGGGGGGTWDTASTPGLSNGYSSGGGGGGACGAGGGGSACYAGGSGNGFSGNGGTGGSESTGKGGGGGAAPEPVGNGGNGVSGNGGNGGRGVISNITGTDVGYGGGGSGSAYPNKTPGVAFDGGGTGGRGRPIDGFEAASAGINGTGGGGGGGFSTGANGGHGVIIIRYKVL
jgi:hypothetical protein